VGPAKWECERPPVDEPAGGNFIAGDGAYEIGAITQTITGLTVGQLYELKFYWAGAQQENFTGATTESWQVTLGSQSFYDVARQRAQHELFGLDAADLHLYRHRRNRNTVVSGDRNSTGEPPFSLLGGVDLELVPDFSNWMVFTGFGTACILFEAVRRRRRQSELAPVARAGNPGRQ